MKILLDTNIIIHREGSLVVNENIGDLFRWLDNLNYVKYVHPVTVDEINKYGDEKIRNAFNAKLASYNILIINSKLDPKIEEIIKNTDKSDNDINDSKILNEAYSSNVDYLVTEDKKIFEKAELLKIGDRVYSIDTLLDKIRHENPDLAEYKTLSVKKDRFININLEDKFFDSFKSDYPDFDDWVRRKSQDVAYVCRDENNKIVAFLYLKIEERTEPYNNLVPTFEPKKRLKIGSFKVILYGVELGERFLKIAFDNAIRFKVDEIYLTIFNNSIEEQLLILLIKRFGFIEYGVKENKYGKEAVYVREMIKKFDNKNPSLTYPHFSRKSRMFIVSIYPEYHTELFPDSILKTESPDNFKRNEPHRNAIRKIYISWSLFRDLIPGDTIIFYRTGGNYKGVISTIGVVQNCIKDIENKDHFLRLCRGRSVFSESELVKRWNRNGNSKPFLVQFLYTYSFPKRINLKKLIELGIIKSAPRGFDMIDNEKLKLIIKETHTDESYIVD